MVWVPIIVLSEKYYIHCSLWNPFPSLDRSALCLSIRLLVWGSCVRWVRAARKATTSELMITALLLDSPYPLSWCSLPTPFCFDSYCIWQKHMSWLVTLMGRISNVLHTWDTSSYGCFSLSFLICPSGLGPCSPPGQWDALAWSL